MAFRITKKVLDQWYYIDSYKWTQNHLKSKNPNHEVELIEVRHKLETLSQVASFTSKNVLEGREQVQSKNDFSRFHEFQSDAVVSIHVGVGQTQKLALEYEHELKAKREYKSKVINYYLSS